MRTEDKRDIVVIGRVGSSSGVKGEFRINLYAADSYNLKEGKNLLFRRTGKNDDDSMQSFEAVCQRVRYQNGKPVVKAEGINDRNASEAMRGMEVYIYAEELEALPEGEHYVRDLIGCTVVDVVGGTVTEIGILKDVIQNTAQSVLEVETREGRSVLIPAVDEFMHSIDEEAKRIEVELIPGFI